MFGRLTCTVLTLVFICQSASEEANLSDKTHNGDENLKATNTLSSEEVSIIDSHRPNECQSITQ